MTTPTREQVVRWANAAGAHMYDDTICLGFAGDVDDFAVELSTLSRADLEATIAEQLNTITALNMSLGGEGSTSGAD